MLLKHEHVVLRRLNLNDKINLLRLANNKKIWDNLRDYMPYPYSESDAFFFIELTTNEEPALTFGIEYKGELCGIIGLIPQKDVYRKTAEIGYWLGEAYWGRGIASIALKLLTHYGLHTLNFARLHTGVFEHNVASMKVLEKNAYHKDGIFKKCVLKNGQLLDEHRYAIIHPNSEELKLTTSE